jgi:hypothetical protein
MARPTLSALFLFGVLGCRAETITYPPGILASFESSAEIQPDQGSAKARASNEHATHGKQSLEVTLEGEESGFGIEARPQPFQFTGAKKLLIDIYREGMPISLIFRVYDADAKPYSIWYYRLQPGPNTVELDVAGMAAFLDVKRVKRIYAYAEQGSGKVFVDNIRLASEPIDLTATIQKPVAHPKKVPPGSGLLNGDFEVGLTGWNSWGEWDDGKYFFGSDFGDNACSGSASLKIICEKRGRGGVFTEPMYMPAGNYELRFWAKGDENGSLMRWTFEGNDQARAAVEKNFESDIFPVDLDWKEYRYEVPLRGDAALRLYFFSVGEGTLYIDGASLVLKGKEDRPPYRVESSQPPREVEIQGNRIFLDGKPFFPIGVYLGKPSMLEETGFNVMMPSVMNPEIIEESNKTGILLTPELTGVMRAHLPWQVDVAMEPFKSHPNIFAWYLCDEPDHAMMTVPPAEMRLATKRIKEMDPKRPTWGVVMSWADANMFQYADTVDILATDIYPIEDAKTKKPLTMVSEKVDMLVKATGGKKPAIAVLQSTPKATPAEEVCMTYLALTHGANGIFYWQLFEAQEDPAVWTAMKNLSREVKALSPVLTAPELPTPSKVSDPEIHTLTRRLGDRLYVLSVNASPGEKKGIKFSHPDASGPEAKVLFEKRGAAVAGGVWSDDFQGYQRHCYSIPLKQ